MYYYEIEIYGRGIYDTHKLETLAYNQYRIDDLRHIGCERRIVFGTVGSL